MAVRKDTVQLDVIINGTKAGGTLKEMRGSIRDLKRELDTLTVGTAEYNKKAAELARATAAMNTHTKAIREQTAVIENGGKRVNTFTDTLKKGAIAAGLFFGAQQVIQWGKQFVGWIVRGTAALEDMRDKSRAVFRDSIDIVEDFAAINAQALGVTEEKYVSLASQIGAMLVPMGFAREEIAEMSADTLNLAGALSEWSGGTLTAEQTQQILGKAILGQTKGLKQLGIAISEADIKNRLAAEGNDKLTGTALKQAKAQATLALIQERSADAQREFANSQEDLGRSANRLSSVFAQLQENFLSKLLPGLKALSGSIADSISPLQRQSDLVEKSKDQFNVLIKTLLDGNLTYQGRLDVIKRINTEYKDYLPSLITEKTSNEELQKVLVDVNAQMEQRIDNLIKEEKLTDAKRRVDAAETAKNLAANRLAEQERIKAKLAAQRASGENGGLGGLDQGQAERNNTALLTEARRQLNEANLELVTSEIHLQSVRINSGGLNVDEVLGRDAAAEAAKAALARKLAEEEQRKLDEQQAEKDKQERERRLNARLKSIEDFHNKERQIRIQATEVLRDDEVAYNAERERINLETDIKIARDQAALYKAGTTQNLKLLQDALDKEAALRKQAHELQLKQRTELINRESELTKLHLREDIEDSQELSRKLEIEELKRVQRLASIKLAGLDDADAEYIALYNDITDRQLLIDKKVQADELAITENTLELQRELTLGAIFDLKLDEEDLQKYRERINAEYDKRILEARLKTFDPDSLDAEKTKNAISEIDRKLAEQGSGFLVPDDVAGTGGSSTPEDAEKKRKALEQAADIALDSARTIADGIIDIDRQRLDDQLQMELDGIDKRAEAKRRAAGDDAVALAQIDAQAQVEREAAEKKAAKKRKELAVKEAIIQGALSVIEALPDVGAAVAAGIAAGLQLDIIQGQSFYEGGRTPSKGIYRDRSGHDVAGVVHTDEYVIPRRIVQDPRHQPVISYLENVRRNRGGFADGGFTTVSTKPAAYVQTMTSGADSADLREIKELLSDIRTITATWPTVIKAVMAYTDFEKTQDTVLDIRAQSAS